MKHNIIHVDFSGLHQHPWEVLSPLTKLRRWVIWRYEDNPGRKTKVPYQGKHPDRRASATDSSTWCTYQEARQAAPDGRIGFVLGDGIGAFDLDRCLKDGAPEPWAQALLNKAASYAEVTPSQDGLRIIGLTRGKRIHQKIAMPTGSLEIYRGDDVGRYVTISAVALNNLPLRDIDAVIDEYAKLSTSNTLGEGRKEDRVKLPKMLPEVDVKTLHRDVREKLRDCCEFDDRHRRLVYVAGEMVRCKYNDATIAAVLLNKSEAVSEHVYKLENERDRLRAVKRAIAEVRLYEPAKPARLTREELANLSKDGIGLEGLSTADTVQKRDPKSHWWPYILQEELFWIASRGGVGKGLLASDITARMTTGRPWPLSNEKTKPLNVLWFESEDNIETTVAPRLEAAGANMKKVAIFERDVKSFRELTAENLARRNVGLIVLSPLLSYLDVKNFRDEVQVRNALEELSDKIRGLPCTILALLHPNKKIDLGAIERLLGSVAFANFVRSVVLLKSEEHDIVRLVHAKYNLSVKGDDLLFVKRNKEPEKHPHGQYITLDWEKAEENIDDTTVFDLKKKDGGDGASASEWLIDHLKDGEWHDLKDIVAQAESFSHSKDALTKAKLRNRRIAHKFSKDFPKKTLWRLRL